MKNAPRLIDALRDSLDVDEEELRKENIRQRFSDNPFRTGEESPEQLEWLRKRDEATRIFHETGDERPAMEIGLFPKKPVKTYDHKGIEFLVTRTSPHSATVGLICGVYKHKPFIVGIVEGGDGWAVGQEKSGPTSHPGPFLEAVKYCASTLHEECEATIQLDSFFADDLDSDPFAPVIIDDPRNQ